MATPRCPRSTKVTADFILQTNSASFACAAPNRNRAAVVSLLGTPILGDYLKLSLFFLLEHLLERMASITRKREGGSWVACYTDREGKQRQNATGTKDEKLAQVVAERLEKPHRNRKLAKRLKKLGVSILPEKGFIKKPGGKTLTGIPEDWIIRQHASQAKMQGGGDPALLTAVTDLAALELRTTPGKLLPESKPLWNDAWSKLGAVLFSHLTISPDPSIFRKLDHQIKEARKQLDSDKKLTREEQIYWFTACFFKKHRRTPTMYELARDLENLEVSVRTIQKTVKSWQHLLSEQGVSWSITPGETPKALTVAEFETPSDLLRARSIYAKISFR
jgi:hypothetical protein